MKHAWVVMLAALCLAGGVRAAERWETDFAKAKEKAAQDGKFMLVDFSGSDWCGWCMKLEKEVFSKNDFKKYAKDNLVLVLIDFPRQKKLSKKDAAQNKALGSEYGVRGYPTVVLMLPDGKEVARTGYQKGGPEEYVKHLQKLLEPFRDQLPAPVEKERERRFSGNRSADTHVGAADAAPAAGAAEKAH